MAKKVIRLNESEMVKLVEKIVRKVNKKPLRESKNRRKFIKEDNNNRLISKLESIFPNLDATIEDGVVLVTLYTMSTQDGQVVFKGGTVIQDENSDVYGIGDFTAQIMTNNSGKQFLDDLDMDINREYNFDDIIDEIKRHTDDGTPYDEEVEDEDY
tara:strand:+ start:534 stop:1001 length:468 start_codon:yes stop_codon:yes gene_type:complete